MTVEAKETLLSARDVAEYLQVSTATVGAWMRTGRIPALKIGKSYRITRRSLEAWCETQQRVTATA